MKEQRELQRFDLQVQTCIDVGAAGLGGEQFSCTTRDISSKGAYIVTDRALQKGTIINLRFDLPIYSRIGYDNQTTSLEATGEVVRTSARGMAVYFQGMCKILPPCLQTDQ